MLALGRAMEEMGLEAIGSVSSRVGRQVSIQHLKTSGSPWPGESAKDRTRWQAAKEIWKWILNARYRTPSRPSQ